MTEARFTDNGNIECFGDWTIHHLPKLEKQMSKFSLPSNKTIRINGENLTSIDSAGAWLIQCIINKANRVDTQVDTQGFSTQHQAMLKLAASEKENIAVDVAKKIHRSVLYIIGKKAIHKVSESLNYFSFVGQLSFLFARFLSRPKAWHFKSIFAVIEDTGFYALPIIGLLSFLIGVVLTYQLGLQLKLYGASAYIVSLSGMAILREFGPLITAIIVAGRTTSSFTAQLGLMKVNEEMDALYAMGISPLNRLAFPRLIGVMIALPLLTIWADAFGILGSILMSDYMLDVHPYDFLARIDEEIDLASLWTGLSKTPVFAILVASVGCFQGFQVSYSAESIGRKTTMSVVQAIFLVIIADAFFSVLFSWAGL